MIGKQIAIWSAVVLSPWAHAAPITAPSDPNAEYSIISVTETDSGLEVITQRTGISGISYSKRQFDCVQRRVLFLGAGSSVTDLENASGDDEPTPLFKGSLARAISDVVCRDFVAGAR
ncbi:hypothetical protein D3C77_527570 [compost metagenome]